MAVTSVTLHWSGATGDATADSLEYTAVYRVQTDNTATGPAAIFSYFRTNGPWLKSAYSYGGDSDSNAICTKVSAPRHVAGSANVWEVTFTFASQPTAGSGGSTQAAQAVDANGDPSQDPADWRPYIWFAGGTQTEPAEKAYYISGFTHPIQKFQPGDLIRVQNSAGDRIDSPPVTQDKPVARMYARINIGDFDVDLLRNVGRILSQKIKIKAGLGYNGVFQAGTLKLSDLNVLTKRIAVERNGIRELVDYREVTAEFSFNPDGWNTKLYDIGFNRQLAAGDPDGKGGTVSFTDILDGLAIRAPILDPVLGQPVKSPQLLDGAGQPLQDPDGDPVVIEYRVPDTFTLGAIFFLSQAFEVVQ
jgi:hypothetical protein